MSKGPVTQKQKSRVIGLKGHRRPLSIRKEFIRIRNHLKCGGNLKDPWDEKAFNKCLNSCKFLFYFLLIFYLFKS
jgi:hypothetical protein